MKLYFEKLILHNFLSFGHSEIDLKEKGYCLVEGINNDKRDNSLSNGSGKSTWSSALVWALTGQTIQGKKTNLKNIWVPENLCYVKVLFMLDSTHFEITRYKEPRSNLTILVNGEDKSGKGIKESELVLAEYLPDLTMELLASIIVLGQGLPLKFTSNTPSGRKEVLEKLSKSDYMIQDIKNRLTKVISDNNLELRKKEDMLLSLNTKEDILLSQKKQQELELNNLQKMTTLESDIEILQSAVETLTKERDCLNLRVKEIEYKQTSLNSELNKLNNDKSSEINLLKDQFHSDAEIKYYLEKNKISENKTEEINKLNADINSKLNSLKESYSINNGELNVKLKTLQNEINRIKFIKDICPTCGQKIPNVIKPDTRELKVNESSILNELHTLKTNYDSQLNSLMEVYNSNKKELELKYLNILNSTETDYNKRYSSYTRYLNEINERYSTSMNNISLNLNCLKKELSEVKNLVEVKNLEIINKTTLLNKTQLDYSTKEQRIKNLTFSISTITQNLDEIKNEKLYNNNEKNTISSRLNVDRKIETLIKRDFRGFLLSNIINYINYKCKEYSEVIFGTSDLNFLLDGNNIEITYLNKSFENLSGGEKQKVDLIIQFAIRDMMSRYLNFSSNIFVLDEIFDNLDSNGCNQVLNLINNYVNDVESLFIISHHANELEIPYDCEMWIIKDENGISKVK